MTEQEYLEDTIRYYSKDPDKLRCVTEGVCHYNSAEPGVVGCAIGRKMKKADRGRLDAVDPNGVGIETVIKYIQDEEIPKSILPAWMRKMKLVFLCDLQRLHDKSEFWDSDGLSRVGFDHVKFKFSNYDLTFLKNI